MLAIRLAKLPKRGSETSSHYTFVSFLFPTYDQKVQPERHTKNGSNDILLRLYAVRLNHNQLAKRSKNDFLAIPQPSRNLLQQKSR